MLATHAGQSLLVGVAGKAGPLLWLLLAASAHGAAVTHAITTKSTSDGTSYTSGSFTPAANDLIVVTVYASGTAVANAPGTMTDSQGLGFTRITSATGAPNSVYAFIANGLSTASSMTVTFNATGDDATGAIITVWRVAGMSRTGQSASKQAKTSVNGNAGGTPSVTFSTDCDANNPTIGFVGNASNPAGLTSPSAWTEPAGADVGYDSPIRGAEGVFRDSGFTGTTIKWVSASATAWHVVAVELDTSAAPTPTTNLGELCQKIDCGTVFSSLLKPTIEQVVPFLSNVTSEGWVVIKGTGFGNEAGEFTLAWNWLGLSPMPLTIPSEPGKDHWKPTYVFGQLPPITGKEDQTIWLQVKTKSGKLSNLFPVNFTAERELKQLQASDVSVNCSYEADVDKCNSHYNTDSVPFCATPFVSAGQDGDTIVGYHWTCVGDSDGTDSYSASLENGWLFESAVFMDLKGSSSATMTGFQSGTDSINVKVNWSNEDVSYVLYRMNISIKGPKGVPHD
jgi:hypothetical protein